MPKMADTGKALKDDVVDASTFLCEGDPEVALQHVGHKDPVLLKRRLVETPPCLQIRFDFR